MMQADARAMPMADVNTTPLIDVMLVLLIIFMISAPMLAHRLPVPSPQPGPPVFEPTQRHLVQLEAIGTDLRLTLDGELISRSDLQQRLLAAARLPEARQPEFRIDAAADVRFDHLVALLSDARRTGAAHVGLARGD
jgi:biopolymer transport protein ExbD